MCPDIENYAPLITAAFGLGDVVEGGHPAHRLRVQLADRSLARTNPLLGVAAQLLDVAGSRATASAVLDLAQARRCGAGSASSTTTSTRWPTGCASPASGGASTPSTGSRSASATSRTPGGSASTGCSPASRCPTTPRPGSAPRCPLDDVGSNRVELAGRFAEYVDRLVAATDRLTGTRPLAEWLDGARPTASPR